MKGQINIGPLLVILGMTASLKHDKTARIGTLGLIVIIIIVVVVLAFFGLFGLNL